MFCPGRPKDVISKRFDQVRKMAAAPNVPKQQFEKDMEQLLDYMTAAILDRKLYVTRTRKLFETLYLIDCLYIYSFLLLSVTYVPKYELHLILKFLDTEKEKVDIKEEPLKKGNESRSRWVTKYSLFWTYLNAYGRYSDPKELMDDIEKCSIAASVDDE